MRWARSVRAVATYEGWVGGRAGGRGPASAGARVERSSSNPAAPPPPPPPTPTHTSSPSPRLIVAESQGGPQGHQVGHGLAVKAALTQPKPQVLAEDLVGGVHEGWGWGWG